MCMQAEKDGNENRCNGEDQFFSVEIKKDTEFLCTFLALVTANKT